MVVCYRLEEFVIMANQLVSYYKTKFYKIKPLI